MREYLETTKNWIDGNNTITLARVVKTWGSSPRPVGSCMLVNDEGKILGSVSGGCVEGAVVKASLALNKQDSARKLSYGVSDEDAWSVGLSCGGSLQVFVQRMDFQEGQVWKRLIDCVENNEWAILISSLEDGNQQNTLLTEKGEELGDPLSEALKTAALSAYDQRTNQTVELEGVSYFIHLFPRKPILLAIGVAHITVDLVALGKMHGFQTIVIDPRGYFTEKTTFPTPPDDLLEAYPSEVLKQFPLDAYTFAAILSHDPKIDDNALEILLPSKVAYVGALGSRKTHAKRVARLTEKGIPQDQIDRIKAPIGMPIHAKSAQEISLAIMGQIIEAKNEFL